MNALSVVSEILSDTIHDPASFGDMPDGTIRCHLNGTFLGHKVLDALVKDGYCVVSGMTPEDAELHPSCWVVRPAQLHLWEAYRGAARVYREKRDRLSEALGS
jgi:hypothetical protein